MSWEALATGIRSLAVADTGSGGLFETGAPMLTGWYTQVAPRSATPPYVVVSIVTDDEDHVGDPDSQLTEYEFDVDLYTNVNASFTASQATRDRIRTVLHRKAPTVTGFSAGHLFRDGGEIFEDGQRLRFVESYTGSISKGA